jgi:hypothetical protein
MIDQSVVDEYTSLQKQMILDLSKSIIIGLSPLEVECPNCSYIDPDNSSLGTFVDFGESITVFSGTSCERVISPTPFKRTCKVCNGKGKLICADEITIPALVTKSQIGLPDSPAGLVSQKTFRLKTDVVYYDYFVNALYYIIDSKKYEKIKPPIKRGMGNQYGIAEVFVGSVDERTNIS